MQAVSTDFFLSSRSAVRALQCVTQKRIHLDATVMRKTVHELHLLSQFPIGRS
jgi:hypothetical protein